MDSISFSYAGSSYNLIVLRSREELSDPDGVSNDSRLLVLYKRIAGGPRSLLVRYDQLVMCQSCGGIFGDLYAGVSFHQDTLKIDHYGGSNWRWSVTHAFLSGSEDARPLVYKHTTNFWVIEPDSTMEETYTAPTAHERLATCNSMDD